ncbi:MAG: hypothetical protein CMH70_03720 [Nitrosomonadaceae bacterium]|nr:hypothetical protein [Nitrosomonadaceae bacterium]|tara:strand:+ start:1283 stop:2698 length:1416 start_codon:yes stop_codon:yes gene_type:complete
MNKKRYRILITPSVAAPYDQRMVKWLADGFNSIGQYAGALSAPVSSTELNIICESQSIDVVLQVNRTRDLNEPLPKNVRFISWFQDVYPETIDGFSDKFCDSDILYSLGDPSVLGIKTEMPCFTSCLFTGVDPETLAFSRNNIEQDLDFSLCGSLPPPVNVIPDRKTDILWYVDDFIKQVPLLGKSRLIWVLRRLIFDQRLPVDYVPYSILVAMVQIVQAFYRPLRGELDIHMLAESMLNLAKLFGETEEFIPRNSNIKDSRIARLIKPYSHLYLGRSDFKARLVRYLARESKIFKNSAVPPIYQAVSYFSQSYPRIMDRFALIDMISKVSKSIEMYGNGLSAHEFTHPYLKGVIENQEDLLRMYCKSKINLNNNTHGLGMHSRTLECMAVGGFIFMHESPYDNKPGGMHTEFEPDVHYGAYTPENIQEEAQRWLADDSGRIRAGKNAKTVIRERHCWHHRAQQIINDLNR